MMSAEETCRVPTNDPPPGWNPLPPNEQPVGWNPPPGWGTPPAGWGAPPPNWDSPPPPWGWPPYPYEPEPPRRRRNPAVALALAMLVAALIVGLVAASGGWPLSQGSAPGAPLLDNGSADVQAIANAVSPAVVDITAGFPDGLAAGTGMIISSNGEVLTNNHVVDGATQIEAQIGGVGVHYDVQVIGTDAAADVALLQIQGVSGLPTVSIGDSTRVSVGDTVVAIGNALGREGPPTASQGQVTGLDRTITATDATGSSAETLTGLIQVDAGIVPGDSGGPLVDQSGRVVGMDTAASARHFRFRSGTSQGFAIPIATAMSVAQRLAQGLD
jgi:S1-C subfamily serine protease